LKIEGYKLKNYQFGKSGVTEEQLKKRTKDFAHSCVKLALSCPSSILGNHLAKQLIRCSTSVAANYRSACLAQSRASFIAKISIVLEEIDESAFWLEFINDEKLIITKSLTPLIDEANELKAIFYTSRKTARRNK
jgi:four helix bundle protein